MKSTVIVRCRWAWLLILLLFSVASLADKHGHKRHDRQDYEKHRVEQHERDWTAHEVDHGYIERRYFTDDHRHLIRQYYDDEYRGGHCPPGLAKKHNGCLPPGQAKRWIIGRPLPRNVIYYDLPPIMIQQLGYPPAGHRFVRVAGDILLIAIASGMVVDAITDLNGM